MLECVGKKESFYFIIPYEYVYKLQTVSSYRHWRKHSRNTITQNAPVPHALCALRAEGVGGWCPCEDALYSGSISTSSAVLINPKPGGRRRNTGGVCGSSGAGASGGRHGRPEGEPGPEKQVSLMGGDAVSGRSVQRKEEEKKQRNWGVSGCGARSYFTAVLFILISICPVEGEVYVVHAFDDFVVDVPVKRWRTRGPCRSSSRINKHYTDLPYEWAFHRGTGSHGGGTTGLVISQSCTRIDELLCSCIIKL